MGDPVMARYLTYLRYLGIMCLVWTAREREGAMHLIWRRSKR